MLFIQKPVFIKQASRLFTDEEVRDLMEWFLLHPQAGEIIADGGGCRKVGWRVRGHETHDGAVVVYFFRASPQVIFLLRAFLRSEENEFLRNGINQFTAETTTNE
ncbi:MAG: hypothetical protein LBS59_08645 [Puniceicoccales bacterium]|nr:hypothetical protein [Puniceicoccales bacterium]